jgi:hypothetical protein
MVERSRGCTLTRSSVLALALAASACLDGYPPYEDLDGDDYTVEEGDCDDLDPLTHPGADECALRGVTAADNDCDGLIDGPALPWWDHFDDENLSSSWKQMYAGMMLLEHTSGDEAYHLDLPDFADEPSAEDGVLEQVGDNNIAIVLAEGAECWQDLWLEARFVPGPQVLEFQCQLQLRGSGYELEGSTPVFGYEFHLNRHSPDVDGNTQNEQSDARHYDGNFQSHLVRFYDGDESCLIRDCEPNSRNNDSTDLDPPAAGDAYIIRVSAQEVAGGTELSCSYDNEDGQGFRPCFEQLTVLDTAPERPLTGGIAIACSSYNYNFWELDEPEGLIIDYVAVKESPWL